METLSYASAPVPVRRDLIESQTQAWRSVGRPGRWWSGAERLAIATETRVAPRCALCLARKAALSPYAVGGTHDGPGTLPAVAVDAVHRIATDPGRLTRAWFDGVMAQGLADAAYVELLG